MCPSTQELRTGLLAATLIYLRISSISSPANERCRLANDYKEGWYFPHYFNRWKVDDLKKNHKRQLIVLSVNSQLLLFPYVSNSCRLLLRMWTTQSKSMSTIPVPTYQGMFLEKFTTAHLAEKFKNDLFQEFYNFYPSKILTTFFSHHLFLRFPSLAHFQLLNPKFSARKFLHDLFLENFTSIYILFP